MSISEKKLSLIERLMRVRDLERLKQIEEILTKTEMEARTQESLDAIENGDVLTLEEFSKKNQDWLKKRYTK